MKKSLSLVVLFIIAVASVNAQMPDEKYNFAGSGVSGKTFSTTSSPSPVYMSINFLVGDGAFGYNVDVDWGKCSHFVFELSGHNDFDDLFLLLGYGLSKVQTKEQFIFRVFYIIMSRDPMMPLKDVVSVLCLHDAAV